MEHWYPCYHFHSCLKMMSSNCPGDANFTHTSYITISHLAYKSESGRPFFKYFNMNLVYPKKQTNNSSVNNQFINETNTHGTAKKNTNQWQNVIYILHLWEPHIWSLGMIIIALIIAYTCSLVFNKDVSTLYSQILWIANKTNTWHQQHAVNGKKFLS